MADRVEVALKHETTGEVKTVKVGLAWPMLFGLLGLMWIPCFVRRLHAEGGVFLLYSLVHLVVVPEGMLMVMVNGVTLVLVIVLIRIGNELTAKNLLQKGFVFSEPESEAAQKAQRAWGLPDLQPTKGDAWKLVLLAGKKYRARKAYIQGTLQ